MPDPIPPAPNPTPAPSIRGYVNAWELVKIVLATVAATGVGYGTIVPLLQSLATGADRWIVDPANVETIKTLIGAAIAILSGITVSRSYLKSGVSIEDVVPHVDLRTGK